ncbi:MAG: dicarboxylate/amino acid:cation symporter [Balneolales bacterium]
MLTEEKEKDKNPTGEPKQMWYQKLHWKIIIGLVLGVVWGLFSIFTGLDTITVDYIQPLGTMFIRMLQLVAIPLVLASLVVGITGLNDIAKLSRMGGKTIAIYMMTTVFAITIGLTVVNILAPGKVLPIETREALMESYQQDAEASEGVAEEALDRGPLDFIVDIVPANFFASASNNSNMLQIVFVALVLGIGLMQIPKDKAEPLIKLFESLNGLIIRIIDLIMLIAPYGVFALIASVIVELGGDDMSRMIELLGALGWYCIAVIVGLLLHTFIVYSSILKFTSKIRLKDFFRGIRPAMLLGFSTSSSIATLPVTMERVEKNLGVNEEVASFVLPVGATVNMDGTSLYQAVAAVFIAQAVGMDLTILQQLALIITAVMASVGTAGVPGAGIIMLVIILRAVDIPVEGIALILGVDRILDMCRTAINITGDAAVSIAVASMEGQLREGDYVD